MQYAQAFFLYTVLVKFSDILTVVGVWYLTWFWRFHSSLFPVTKGIPGFQKYSEASWPLALVFCAMFHLVGAYRRDRILFGFRALKKIVQGVVMGSLVFVAALYFLEEANISRIYLVVFTGLCLLFVTFERLTLHLLWSLIDQYLISEIRILLIGGGDLLRMYVEKLEDRKPYPILWVGRLGPESTAGELSSIPYLGSEQNISETLSNRKVHSVVISYPTGESSRYSSILEAISNEPVDVKVVPDFGRYSTFTYSADQECGIPLLAFNQPPLGSTDRALKRVVDFFGSILLLLIFSPVFLLVAILIKLGSKGPVFYSQLRMGADGKLFQLYKFRSMRVDAESKTGAVWAVENDDRTTPIGKFLRRTSLDEIPQFFNVLRGDMSLVGPRPERPIFVDQFKREVPRYMLRHRIKSGITGWAQVNGWRGNTSIEERIKHDLYYIGHWSHLFDIKILCLTLIKGFIHRHAY